MSIPAPRCSCIICRKDQSAKGIYSHYITAHTVEGNERIRNASNKGIIKAAKSNKSKAIDRKELNKIKYETNPKFCAECNSMLSLDKKNGKFCSHSCSAKYTNRQKDHTKIKTGPPKGTGERCVIRFCDICGTLHQKRYAKTCSDECKSKLLSNNMIERIKNDKRSNYRRDKQSWLEKSFEDWLNSLQITNYIPEHTIHNHINNCWYFVDFFFPSINLIVELDGKQHEIISHQEKDKLRDSFITNELNIRVFRISHNEYQTQSKVNELRKILVSLIGNAPISAS